MILNWTEWGAEISTAVAENPIIISGVESLTKLFSFNSKLSCLCVWFISHLSEKDGQIRAVCHSFVSKYAFLAVQANTLGPLLFLILQPALNLLVFLLFSSLSQSPLRSSEVDWSLSELDVLLLAGTVGHTLSLAASSFVEEEHQTWYFLLNTLCLTVFQDVCRKYFREKRGSGDDEEHILPSKDHHPSAHPKAEIFSEKWLALATPPFTLLCCRLLRSLNQTGVQWAHIPDVGHWLNRWVFWCNINFT